MELLRNQMQMAREFQRKNLKFIFPITTLIFIIAITFFSIYLSMHPGTATRLLFLSGDKIDSSVHIAGLLPELMQNLFTGLYLIVLGLIPFLFIPLWFIIFNGSLIGILLGSTSISTLTPGYLIAYMMPHGIIMIPTMLLAASYGVYLCKCILLHLLHKKRVASFQQLFLHVARAYYLIIAPLMILATLLKVFIAPLFMYLF